MKTKKSEKVAANDAFLREVAKLMPVARGIRATRGAAERFEPLSI